jgi:streptogramin lyase
MKTPTHVKRTITGTSVLFAMLMASMANADPVDEFPLTIAGSHPVGIVAGPDGNLWFTEEVGRIGRMHPTGSLTEFSTIGTGLEQIVVGPDNNLWFVEATARKIGRIETDGTTTEFPTRCNPNGYITSGPNNSVWFPEACSGGEIHISEMATLGAAAGTISEHTLGMVVGRELDAIATGIDGNVWFADRNRGSITRLKVSTDAFTEFVISGASHSLSAVVRGPDDKLWFSFDQTIGRISAEGDIDEFELQDTADAISFMAPAPDGSVWGSDVDGTLWRIVITPSGMSQSRYSVSHHGDLIYITPGPDGNLWFTEYASNAIGRIFSDVVFFDGFGDEP